MNLITRVWIFSSGESEYTLEALDNAASLDAASQSLVGGVYTTFRTYQHDRILHLQDHFDRLEQSVKLQGRDLTLSRDALRGAIREIISRYPNSDVRLRVHGSLMTEKIRIYLMAEPFIAYPEELYVKGVAAQTLEMQRENPASKATNFIDLTGDLRKSKPAGINEYLMIGRERKILEGMSSNIFIARDRSIWTAGEGILPGITRQMALKVITGLNIPVILEGYPADQLSLADEVFITSASRGVMPVTRIDDLPVGSGVPGPLTGLIRAEFERFLQSEVEAV